MGELRNLVTDDEDGVFNVSTDDGATHRLDLNRRIVTTSADVPAADGIPASRPVRIVTVVTCRVRRPMVMLIDRGVPEVSFTHRTAPPVISIDRVGAPGADQRQEHASPDGRDRGGWFDVRAGDRPRGQSAG